jgi:outer membrane biosynthesis protein TonB
MAAYNIVPIEHNIKQAITAAVKAVEFKKYNVEPDEVVDNLLADIFKSLFPHNPALVAVDKVEIVQIPVVPPAPEEKPKKGRSKKAAAAPEEKPAEPEQPKKKGGRPKKEKAAEEPEKKNLVKLNPSQRNALKKISEAADPKEFLVYVNGLSEEDYKSKTFEDHVQNFVKPKEKKEEDRALVGVEFEGKEYYVDPETKKVYEPGEDGVDNLVGHVGMLKFKDMEIPAHE